ncbi:thermonuclease family protein [Metabacillus niabensis]|uniref:Endonuclease YncB(Thermonuclease family) n=1 Tax=Metabacillus niabensis TaxID=324854 RepID=A0ABT9Z3Q4_9BACI|nr:thermonuclease family protein [Metabacillus niabensis]MDQ0226888.1 endonuclease YncB(thermonuclease family) [Metabacillus niabensis]
MGKGMKKALACVILLFFLAGCTFGQPTNGFIDAEVIKVIDGDTIKVRVNGKEETVRLLLIDTPETVHPTKPVQPFGVEASNFTKEKLTGKDVQLEMDVGERVSTVEC